jgi:hypothetical protein
MGWPQTNKQGNDSRIRAAMAITALSLLKGSKNLLAHWNWLNQMLGLAKAATTATAIENPMAVI